MVRSGLTVRVGLTRGRHDPPLFLSTLPVGGVPLTSTLSLTSESVPFKIRRLY